MNNNPVKYIDPSGHMRVACSDTAGACAGDNWNMKDPKQAVSFAVSSIRYGVSHSKSTPVTNFVNNLPGSANSYSTVSKIFDVSAEVLDLYAAGVVTYGGFAGAGVALPFALGGPEIPVATGLAGMAVAELAVQPLLRYSTILSFASSTFTFMADTKKGTTTIEHGVIASSTLNSFALASAGASIPEAYTNLVLQTLAVANDFNLLSFPWPNSQ